MHIGLISTGALYQLGVLCKDYKSYFMDVTNSITSYIENNASKFGRPIQYLASSKKRKEDIAKKVLSESPIDDGLICVLKILKPCKTAKVYGSDSRKPAVKSCYAKCLHYYLYYLDKVYGFMFVKIQTWFPFNIQVYINGREMMKSVFDKNNISYQCYDNSFTDISDAAKAQALADKFDSKKLCRSMDAFAKSINPFLDTVQNTFGQGCYWCVNQCEFATDVFTFMGSKPNPRFQGEAVSDYKDRPVGCRVKFKLKSNSIRMYDKCSALRIETTVNDPREFKVYATVNHRDIGKVIFPGINDSKKLSSKVSRTLKKLRQHGLIKKVPKSRRYHVTSKGHRIMGTLIELRRKFLVPVHHICISTADEKNLCYYLCIFIR